MYTSGVYVVKEGREDEFARRWQEGADAGALEFPDVKFMLFRDAENPRRFVSLAQPRRSLDHCLEHRREIAGRGIDDAQHLGRRGLLLQRLARLGDEPRVLDRDDRLRREIL